MTLYGSYLKEKFWKYLFDTSISDPLPRPTGYKLHLHTADPGDDGSSNEVPTATWTNYAEVTVNNDGSTSPYFEEPWADGTEWHTDNNGQISFGTPTMSPTTATVTVTHASVQDASGNCFFKGELVTPIVAEHGTPFNFADGDLNIIIR